MDKIVTVRKAELDDFQGVHKLVMQVHKLHVSERNDIFKSIDPMIYDEFKNELLNSNNIYLVAELENKIVGICFSQIREVLNNKILKNRRILHIENICVDENYQRKGIGKKLYTKTLQLAKDKKIYDIELMVWGFNENAISFYKMMGMSVKNLRFEKKINDYVDIE